MTKYNQAIEQILLALKNELPEAYTYHSYAHTIEVLELATEIAKHEKVKGEQLELVRVAAAYHDSGFLNGREQHEEKGCALVDRNLPKLGFTEAECEIIKGMIMATKIPQTPQNHLEKIICDADLGYIGGDHYYEIAEDLKSEMATTSHPLSRNAWLDLQISFLKAQSFFTPYAVHSFERKKNEILKNLIEVRLKE